MSQDHYISLLRQAIEAKVDREMHISGDYTYLSECIFEELHQTVSPTTLKRLWGYLSEPVTPRISTLDILANFVGEESFEAFCQKTAASQADSQKTTDSQTDSQQPPQTATKIPPQPLGIMAVTGCGSRHRRLFPATLSVSGKRARKCVDAEDGTRVRHLSRLPQPVWHHRHHLLVGQAFASSS